MHRVRGRFYNFPPYIRDNCGIWQEILYDIWTFVMSSEGILKCKFQCCSKYYCEDGQMRMCNDITAPRIMLNFIRIRHGKNRLYKMHQSNPKMTNSNLKDQLNCLACWAVHGNICLVSAPGYRVCTSGDIYTQYTAQCPDIDKTETVLSAGLLLAKWLMLH